MKKDSGTSIRNEMGEVFGAYDFFECKGPGDGLSVDDHHKTIAYAFLDKSKGKKVSEIRERDLSATMVRFARPLAMLKTLVEEGACVTKRHPEIHDVSGVVRFPTQVVYHTRLTLAFIPPKGADKKIPEQDARNFVKMASYLSEKGDRDDADAAMRLIVSSNQNPFDGMRWIRTCARRSWS